MAFLDVGLEPIVIGVLEITVLRPDSVLRRFTERHVLLAAPRLVRSFGFLVGDVRSVVAQRIPDRRITVERAIPQFFEGAVQPFLLAADLT
jgi:hypothetical protein